MSQKKPRGDFPSIVRMIFRDGHCSSTLTKKTDGVIVDDKYQMSHLVLIVEIITFLIQNYNWHSHMPRLPLLTTSPMRRHTNQRSTHIFLELFNHLKQNYEIKFVYSQNLCRSIRAFMLVVVSCASCNCWDASWPDRLVDSTVHDSQV